MFFWIEKKEKLFYKLEEKKLRFYLFIWIFFPSLCSTYKSRNVTYSNGNCLKIKYNIDNKEKNKENSFLNTVFCSLYKFTLSKVFFLFFCETEIVSVWVFLLVFEYLIYVCKKMFTTLFPFCD